MSLIEFCKSRHSVAFVERETSSKNKCRYLNILSTIIYYVLKTSEFAFGWVWRQAVVVGLSCRDQWYTNGFKLQSWTKVLGCFCISGAFSNSHRSNPFPHPTNNVGRVYPEFFWEFQLCTGWGEGGRGGRTARKFRKWCTVLGGNREMTEKSEYCRTVPRTFVQDCLNPGFGEKREVCLLHFSYAF